MNNTKKTHDFVDLIAKLSTEKGVSFDFTNNENLKNSGFAIQDRTINGLVQGKDIILNVDSKKALNTVVGHEITHVLEGTELYDELQNTIIEYAKSKGEYDGRWKDIVHLYRNQFQGELTEERMAQYKVELTADLVGDYLFTDSDFINRLSAEKPSIFKKIYDEIKYLYKVATAGSKEARELEKVKRAFDKAFKENENNNIATKYTLYLNENEIPNYLNAGSRENKNRQNRFREGKQMIISSDEEVDMFVKKSIDDNRDNIVAYGKVDSQLAEKIKQNSDSQIDVSNAYLELLSNDVHHAYREHAVAKEDGDLDMSVDDLLYALKNVNVAEVVNAKTYKDGSKRVTLAIPMDDGVMMLVELASKSAGSLRLKTGWKITNEKYKQKYKSSPPTTGNNSSTKTVHDDTASTNIISKEVENTTQTYSISEDSHERKLTNEQIEFYKDAKIASISNYNVYGKDIALLSALNSAKTPQNSADYSTEDYAPLTEDERRARLEEMHDLLFNRKSGKDIEGNEIIESRLNSAENNVAKSESNEPKTAKILTEEPAPLKQERNFLDDAMEMFVDKGYVFEKLSKKTKNRELEAKWNFILYADRTTLEDRYGTLNNKPVFGNDVTADDSYQRT